MEPGVVVSPVAKDPAEVPDVSLPDYVLDNLKNNLSAYSNKPWVVDVVTGCQIKFGDLEEQTRRVASALVRLGFKHGDVLYYVTYESANLLVVLLAAWRVGGAVRGSYQEETAEMYATQIRETRSQIVLVDSETSTRVQEALSLLDWSITLLCLDDDVSDAAIPYSKLLHDDGAAFPEKVEINAREDVLSILNTSGSTGNPKGAIITHFAAVSLIHGLRDKVQPISQFSLGGTFSVSYLYCSLASLFSGATIYFLSKFRKQEFLDHLVKHKPTQVTMYPYVASWFARNPDMSKYDLSFLRLIVLGGSVVDPATVRLLHQKFPSILIMQIYALTECMGVTYTAIAKVDLNQKIPKIIENRGELCVAVGQLLPYVQAKIVDPDTGKTLLYNERGEIVVRAPYVMKGYITSLAKASGAIKDDGWYHTGDIGFFDEENILYVRGRLSQVFKYFMHFVMPSEIEAVLQEHEAVQSAGVVGVVNPETTSLARAYVVPRHDVTAHELQAYVAARLPPHKQLHGGVVFLDQLPMNRGGKLDRIALQKLAAKSADR